MMKEFSPEAAKAAAEQAHDVIENIRKIKGQKYVDAVSGMVHCEYLMISLSMFLRNLQAKGVIKDGDAPYQAFAGLMAGVLSGFFSAAGLDCEQDREEIIRSSDTIRELTTFGVKADSP